MTDKHLRENTVEQHLGKALERLGVDCIKVEANYKAGIPDRIAVLPGGQVLWVELKTDTGRLSKLQEYQHQRLRRQGHQVRVVWSTEQADELVREIEKTLQR